MRTGVGPSRTLSIGGLVLCVLMVAPGPVAAQSVGDVQPPRTLRVGFATYDRRAAALDGAELASVLRALEDAATANESGIETEVALGTDYQILRWLEEGTVEAALISPFARHLLTQRIGEPVLRHVGEHGERHRELLRGRAIDTSAGTSAGPEGLVTAIRALRRSAEGDWAVLADPVAEWEAAVSRLPSGSAAETLFAFSSHLSTSGFLAAHSWARDVIRRTEDPSSWEDHWHAFERHSTFLLGRGPRTWSDAALERLELPVGRTDSVEVVIEFADESRGEAFRGEDGWVPMLVGRDTAFAVGSATPLRHLMVSGPLVGPVFPESAVSASVAAPSIGAIHDALEAGAIDHFWAEERPSRNEPLRFVFTVPELVELTRLDQELSGVADFALVLPGGGVKAAYQSAVVDYLYGGQHIRNALAPRSQSIHPQSEPLAVSMIAGTSGGALLGAFVAAIASPQEDGALFRLLWRPDDGSDGVVGNDALRSFDVFPLLDLPRWLGVFVGAFVFGVVLLTTFALWDRLERIDAFQRQVPKDTRSRTLVTLPWLGALAVIPWLFKYVIGDYGVEHVPPVAGAIYFVCILIVLYGDNAFVKKGPLVFRKTPFLVGAASLLVIAATLVSVRVMSGPAPNDIPLQHWTLAAGVVGVLTAYLGLFWVQPEDTLERDTECLMWALGLVLAVPVSAFVMVGALYLFGRASMLELTRYYWWPFLLTCFLASAAIVGYAAINRSLPGRETLRKVLAYLVLPHPSKRLSASRFARALVISGAGWLWWNAVVAPGLYGNGQARSYLDGRFAAFYEPADTQATAELKTNFIVPATSLVDRSERYFAFLPPESGRLETPEVRALVGEGTWRLFPEPTKTFLRSVVFASGSPFPLLPPTRVEYPQDSLLGGPWEPEWLVDGGFAHNRPIEAVRRMGARQVLVIESTPQSTPRAEASPDPARPPHERFFSQTVRNLPLLLPYLLERSQVADTRSREGLFVAEVSPSHAEGERPPWPLLHEFRSGVVTRLAEEARTDLTLRVGHVRSWGTPRYVWLR